MSSGAAHRRNAFNQRSGDLHHDGECPNCQGAHGIEDCRTLDTDLEELVSSDPVLPTSADAEYPEEITSNREVLSVRDGKIVGVSGAELQGLERLLDASHREVRVDEQPEGSQPDSSLERRVGSLDGTLRGPRWLDGRTNQRSAGARLVRVARALGLGRIAKLLGVKL